MWILSSHYRKPLLYDEKFIKSFSKPLKRIKDALNSKSIKNDKILESSKEFDKFNLALSNDLNTSVALSQIISLSKKINISKNKLNISSALSDLKKMLQISGLCQNNDQNENNEVSKEIVSLIKKRNEFRKLKDFAKADEIRDQLLKNGINVIDRGDNSSWEKI